MRSLILAGLCLAAYLPAFDNGFISDDYVNLEHARHIWSDPLYLLDYPPQNFRVTTFASFSLLESLFGYRAGFFYGFSILVHFVNCVLLRRLLTALAWDPDEAWLAASLFAVFQAPQEAVMWLSGIAEALLATTVLGVLLLWLRGRVLLSVLVYCLALITKESAPVVLAVLPLLDWHRGRGPFSRDYLWFWGPTLVFALTFLRLSESNLLLGRGAYAFSGTALTVLLLSLHRLIWPWFYILVALTRAARGCWPGAVVLVRCSVLMLVAMLPYAFLTYDRWLPSRHVYLASLVLVPAMAWTLVRIPRARLRQAFVLVFIVFNVAYIRFRKDAQFEERAAPTTMLVEELGSRSPTPVMLYDFAYPYPEIPRAVPVVLPDWTPGLIRVAGHDPECAACLGLRWDPETQRYVEVPE